MLLGLFGVMITRHMTARGNQDNGMASSLTQPVRSRASCSSCDMEQGMTFRRGCTSLGRGLQVQPALNRTLAFCWFAKEEGRGISGSSGEGVQQQRPILTALNMIGECFFTMLGLRKLIAEGQGNMSPDVTLRRLRVSLLATVPSCG